MMYLPAILAASEFWAVTGPWAIAGVGTINAIVLGALLTNQRKGNAEIKSLREHVDRRINSMYEHVQAKYAPREVVEQQLIAIGATLKSIEKHQIDARAEARESRDSIVRMQEQVKQLENKQ